MFPCSKVFHLNGKPTFNIPEDKQVAFGRQLEKIVKAQRFTFKETCLLPPARTNGDRNFEYRILQTLDPHGEHYAIRFKYFESDNTLEIYSEIPAERVLPIATYIVENYLNVHLGETISTSYHHIDTTVKKNPVEELVVGTREHPLNVRLVDVAPSAGKSLRAALKDPGGRPKKTTHGAEHYTQKAFAAMLNTACNCKSFTVNIIHDWEHGRSEIPFAWIDGERITYSAEIRKFPSQGNNRAILEAIIKELKTGHWVAKSVLQKNTLHLKSPETLAKASGQVAAAIRDQGQLKYGK